MCWAASASTQANKHVCVCVCVCVCPHPQPSTHKHTLHTSTQAKKNDSMSVNGNQKHNCTSTHALLPSLMNRGTCIGWKTCYTCAHTRSHAHTRLPNEQGHMHWMEDLQRARTHTHTHTHTYTHTRTHVHTHVHTHEASTTLCISVFCFIWRTLSSMCLVCVL